jgi:hypothetical protein
MGNRLIPFCVSPAHWVRVVRVRERDRDRVRVRVRARVRVRVMIRIKVRVALIKDIGKPDVGMGVRVKIRVPAQG